MNEHFFNVSQVIPRQAVKICRGYLCFLRIKFLLSVGAFFERPWANTVRPYRV